MKIRNTTTKLIGIIMAFAILAAISAVRGTKQGYASAQSESAFLLLPVGVSSGQSVRISVQNRCPGSEIIVTGVSFLDGEGNRFDAFSGRGGPVIAPGSFASFDVNRDALSIAGEPNGRLQLVGLVVVSSEHTGGVNITGEVFNNADGATTVFYPPNPNYPPNPYAPSPCLPVQ